MDLQRLQRAVESDLAAEHGPLAWMRSRSRPARLSMLLGLASALVLFVGVTMPRLDLATYPTARLQLTVVIHTLILVAAGWLALQPLWLSPPRWGATLVLAVGLLVPVGLALLPEVATVPAAAQLYATTEAAWYCFADGALLGGAVVILARLVDRAGHRAERTAVLASILAGMTAMVGLQLQCPFNYPSHLLAGHATVPLGLLLGYRLLRKA